MRFIVTEKLRVLLDEEEAIQYPASKARGAALSKIKAAVSTCMPQKGVRGAGTKPQISMSTLNPAPLAREDAEDATKPTPSGSRNRTRTRTFERAMAD